MLQVHFRVLPNSTYSLTYNLYPLTPGHVTLPRLHVNMSRFPGSMDDVIQKMLPSHIFIKVIQNPGEEEGRFYDQSTLLLSILYISWGENLFDKRSSEAARLFLQYRYVCISALLNAISFFIINQMAWNQMAWIACRSRNLGPLSPNFVNHISLNFFFLKRYRVGCSAMKWGHLQQVWEKLMYKV